MQDALYIDDKKLKRLCQAFCIKVGKRKFKTLLIVTRWWLIPWYHVATWLDINDIRTVSVSSYKYECQPWTAKFNFPNLDDTDDILVFDELTDTWQTMSRLKENLESKYPDKNISYWVLMRYKHSSFTPDIWFCDKTEERTDFYYESAPEELSNDDIIELLKWHF